MRGLRGPTSLSTHANRRESRRLQLQNASACPAPSAIGKAHLRRGGALLQPGVFSRPLDPRNAEACSSEGARLSCTPRHSGRNAAPSTLSLLTSLRRLATHTVCSYDGLGHRRPAQSCSPPLAPKAQVPGLHTLPRPICTPAFCIREDAHSLPLHVRRGTRNVCPYSGHPSRGTVLVGCPLFGPQIWARLRSQMHRNCRQSRNSSRSLLRQRQILLC